MPGRGVAVDREPDAIAAFRGDLAADGLRPLWDVMGRLAPREPAQGGVPCHWRWEQLRRHVLRAGALISAEQAERRVLVLENPAFPGEARITSSLYAGIQLLLPGETAPSHRHTAAALRFVLEGSGAYTSVGGERATMSPGDFLVTPSGTFHDHGNASDQPVMWLDGLDVFIVNLLNAAFSEAHPGDTARPGSTLPPYGFETGRSSPLFAWPYERTRAALHALRDGPVDPALGIRLDYVDPASGASPLRTMTASMTLLPRDFAGESRRCTAGAVMSVVEGEGSATIGGRRYALAPKDVFVVPSWTWHSFKADGELVLFGFSDEVLQRHLGYWREERRERPEE